MNDREDVLFDVFQRILDLSRDLFDVLTREAAVLDQHRLEAIGALSVEKQSLVSALGVTTLRLEDWLRSKGFAEENVRIADVLGRLHIDRQAASALTDRWAEISALSARCKHLNESNGARIDLLNLHFKRALQILSGHTQAPQTYGPDGSAIQDVTQRSLVSV